MEENPKAWPFKWKLRTQQYFSVILFINKNIMLNNVVPTFESVGGVILCDHSDESYWAVLSRGSVYYPVQGGSNFWVCQWMKSYGEPFKQNHLSSTFTYNVHFVSWMKFGIYYEFWLWAFKRADRQKTNEQTNPEQD